MVKTKKVGAAGRFGARYGIRVRKRIAEIEKKQRKKQCCPYCKHLGTKRLAKGLWLCNKCKRKFSAGAYYL